MASAPSACHNRTPHPPNPTLKGHDFSRAVPSIRRHVCHPEPGRPLRGRPESKDLRLLFRGPTGTRPGYNELNMLALIPEG